MLGLLSPVAADASPADAVVSNVAINMSPGGATLSISATPNRIFGIQSDIQCGPSNVWAGLLNFTQPASNFVWHDAESSVQKQRYYRVVPGPVPIGSAAWETADIGAVWSDDFNRDTLESNWVVLGSADVSLTNGELQLSQTNKVTSRQLYYAPWLTCSDSWTIRWSQRFGDLNPASVGVGVGLKNFQAFGGDDRGYNLLLAGAGTNLGKPQFQRFDGSNQVLIASGPAIALAAGDIVDCSVTRSGWGMTATVSNRANTQVSVASFSLTNTETFPTPVISRVCLYPLGGTVYVDNLSFAINHRKPARFVVVGGSTCEAFITSTFAKGWVSVMQSNFVERICNDSSSYNTTTNSLSVVPEILAHKPGTAILMIGGNDLYFNVPASQWQGQYSNLVAQLRAAGVMVKHCYPTPRNTENLVPLKDWITATYSTNDIIDTWTPFVTNTFHLKTAYDSGDGVHPNDAGHLLIGQIISAALQ